MPSENYNSIQKLQAFVDSNAWKGDNEMVDLIFKQYCELCNLEPKAQSEFGSPDLWKAVFGEDEEEEISTGVDIWGEFLEQISNDYLINNTDMDTNMHDTMNMETTRKISISNALVIKIWGEFLEQISNDYDYLINNTDMETMDMETIRYQIIIQRSSNFWKSMKIAIATIVQKVKDDGSVTDFIGVLIHHSKLIYGYGIWIPHTVSAEMTADKIYESLIGVDSDLEMIFSRISVPIEKINQFRSRKLV